MRFARFGIRPERISGFARATWRSQLPRCRTAMLRSVVDLVFPPLCAMCTQPMDVGPNEPLLCAVCLAQLERLEGPLCRRCSMPLRGQGRDRDDCLRCRRRRYRFESALAFGVYRGALRSAVIRAKRSAEEPLAYALGQLLGERLLECARAKPWDVIVPMPTHWRKRWKRGGNGAEIIAQAVARKMQTPYEPRALRVRRATAKQGMLTPNERRLNVHRAFGVRRNRITSGARVLLIDDVMTTGATASEAAGELRRAGADAVTVAVVARGVGTVI